MFKQRRTLCPCGCGDALSHGDAEVATVSVGIRGDLAAACRFRDFLASKGDVEAVAAADETIQLGARFATGTQWVAHWATMDPLFRDPSAANLGREMAPAREVNRWTARLSEVWATLRVVDPEWVAWWVSAGAPVARVDFHGGPDRAWTVTPPASGVP